jgi:hypothetical protein
VSKALKAAKIQRQINNLDKSDPSVSQFEADNISMSIKSGKKDKSIDDREPILNEDEPQAL